MNHETTPASFNILVVDDTPDSLRLLVGILSEQGYRVRAAPNGKLALAAAQAVPPDLILLDINMPEMDGYEVCTQIKAHEQTCDIPVLFLSAWTDVFDKVRAFSVGGVDYITKPFQIEEVVARIKTHLTLCFLQNQLKQQNEHLTQTLRQLQTTQSQLIQSEKMAALGQLVASVAHEINTPLGAIRSSAENIDNFLRQNLEQLPGFLHSLAPQQQQNFFALLHQSIESRAALFNLSSREKRQFKRVLIQQLEEHKIINADTLADTLVDIGVRPTSLQPFLAVLQDPEGQAILNWIYQLASLQSSTQTITTAATQAARVVLSLKSYAYPSLGGKKVETDVIEGIETALTLYHSSLKHSVTVIKNFAELSLIQGYPAELNQVWTNLIHNSLQAMNCKGTLTIAAIESNAWVLVNITDTGKGIPAEIQSRIFEPFFTTKPPGEGSGLGLSIVKKIVDKHGGKIEVESGLGHTTFSVFLPIA
jgi:two-component system NtrC family sensor kinase